MILGGASVEQGSRIGSLTLVQGDLPRLDPLTSNEVVWQGSPAENDSVHYIEPVDFWSDQDGHDDTAIGPVPSSLVACVPSVVLSKRKPEGRGSELEQDGLLSGSTTRGMVSGYGSGGQRQ